MDYNDPSVSYSTVPAPDPAVMSVLLIGMAVAAVLGLVALVAGWKLFAKAGKPGWAILVPFYNLYVMLEIVGRPPIWMLWIILAGILFPPASIVFSIILSIDTAKSFGKSTAFGVVGLFLFSIIGTAILAFGKATYQGPSAASGPGATPVEPQAPTPAAV